MIPENENRLRAEVALYCTSNAIKKAGNENLKELVSLIKGKTEPRAVAALADAFPALAKAVKSGAVGKEISFYIYDTNGDSQAADKRNTEGAVAYISGGYYGPTDYKYIFGVNINTLYEKKGGSAHFTKENVAKYFGGDKYNFNRRLDGTEEMVGGYLGGSLAIIYLSKLVAGSGASGAKVASVTVRDGFNTILSKIHNGTSLDAVIKGTGQYTDINDFEKKFLKGDDPSAQFCVDYLNRLDKLERNGNRATGSILVDFSSRQKSVLQGRTEDSSTQKALKIIAKNDFFPSTVDDAVAKKSAGTFHAWNDSYNPQG